MDNSNLQIKRILPYLILVTAALLMLNLSKRSFCFSDECFYFSTANRFLQGDRLFVHDWFPTQMVSLIIMPFQKLYVSVTGSNDGIILYFRVLYVLFSFFVSLCIFNLLRPNKGDFCALACALWNLFYVHLNIATVSYYTVSMGCFLLAMVLVYSHIRSGRKSHIILSGLSMALAVLSLPTLAIAWSAAMFILLLFSFCIKKHGAEIKKEMLLHLCGILIAAVPVTAYLLFTTGISGVIKNAEYLLSDEEHVMGLVYPFKNFFISVFDVFGKPFVILMVAFFVILLVCSFVVQKQSLLFGILNTLLLLCIVLTPFFCYNNGALHTGFSGTLLVLVCLPFFGATNNTRKDILLFLTVYLGGLIFSMVYSYSSMCDLYVLSIGHNISAIAGICFIYDYTCDYKKSNASFKYYGVKIPAFFIILLTLCVTAGLRFTNVYRDDRPENLTCPIEEGPAKGLYTSQEHYMVYICILNAIRENETPGKNVFFTKLLPWGYLATDMRCGAYSTWRIPLSSERLRQYYTVHPDKQPDVIFVMNENVGSYESSGDVERDPAPNLNDTKDSAFYSDMQTDSYVKTEYEYCTVYIKQNQAVPSS